MPDLPSRYAEEAAIASVLMPLFTDLKDSAIKNPYSVDWQQFQRQANEELSAKLVGIYLLAAMGMESHTGSYHPDSVTLDVMASQYAQARAELVVASMTTKLSFDVGGARNEAQNLLSTGASVEQSKDLFQRRIDATFADSRITTLAATETTATISASESDVANYANGQPRTDEDVTPIIFPWWNTERDDLVCPVCSPLNDKPRSFWGALFSLGPPGHPSCRCRLRWRII